MRRIFRVAKSAVVFSLVFMMTVDTANACRLFSWLFAHRGACCTSSAPSMGVSLTSSYSSPVSYAPPVIFDAPIMAAPLVESFPIVSDVVASNCCCCNANMGGIVDSGYIDSGYVDGGYIADEGYPVESYGGYVDQGYADGGGYVESGEMIMDASPVDLAPTDTIVAPTPYSESTPALAPAESMPAEDTVDTFDAPADDTPTFDAPADDAAFDAPADDAPADDAFDAPADNPLSDAAEDDMFNGGGDAPADGGGDLFDNPPADDAPADDLFDGGGDAPADDSEDLFGGGAPENAAPAIDETPADAASPDENSLDDLDDLFGQSSRGGMRVWTDNTGGYQTVGRLVVIAKTHIRLLKDNGRYSTVPLTRLSEQDVEYVMAVAVKLTGPQRLASR